MVYALNLVDMQSLLQLLYLFFLFVERPFAFIAPKTYYLAFQSFDFERTRGRLFQKRAVCTKFDIYLPHYVVRS